ncbi:hypothetical protein L5515_000094 [Caenorhabditis briggsae]|uniref:RNA-directed RNA polymerase n=1 Tax=Caenorhabditis briggsae TaxID=6238 RepID=A0AAE9E1E2_CAEBR|nr:hypothetical protein L5515_000094 [Caenorhabditis briggsae]
MTESSSPELPRKLRHGFIKLEFPESTNSRKEMEIVIGKLLAGLPESLQRYGIQIEREHPMQVVQEEDCDACFEVNYEVTCEEFKHNIINAMQRYMDGWRHCVAYAKPTILLHSLDFWRTTLHLQVNDVPLSAIYFGNIQGNAFINHYEVSFWRENEGKSIRRKTPMNNITVDFEFDKCDMICVNFQCVQIEEDRNANAGGDKRNQFNKYDNKNQKKMKKMTVNYQVTVRSISIRRIIVDTNVTDRYGDRTRVHFELNCPPLIRKGIINADHADNPYAKPFYQRWKVIKKEWDGHGWPNEAAISDSPIFTVDFDPIVQNFELHRILSRLRVRTGVSIEFGMLPAISVPMCKRWPYHRWTIKDGKQLAATDTDAPIFRDFLADLFPKKFEVNDDDKLIDVNDERKFSITYLIECLISRGAVVKDQILLDEHHWRSFLGIIWRYYKVDDKLCESALEDLIHLVDGRKRIGSIIKCFDKICQKRQRMQLINCLSESEIRSGFQRVRKVIFTPTRVIYISPETIMGNRVLRKFDKDGTRVIRITFRDDNNNQMRANDTGDLLEMTANKFLGEGIRIANREFGFLGCSNSQMRDNGAYFMAKYSQSQLEKFLRTRPNEAQLKAFKPRIMEVRKHLGKFDKLENIPKLMARMGQCFTQSRLTGVELNRSDYIRIPDFEGGKNLAGKPYTFSDGVGIMSYRFAQKVAHAMQMGNSVPSSFQIRFRGMKGMIAIDPYMDLIHQWNVSYDIPYQVPNLELKCAFRPSQIKFEAKSLPGDQIEMVKYSAPVMVALNKPFINILDQVSEMQSLECHKRVTGRVEELMDRQILSFARQMNDETYCRNRLKEFPRRIDIDFLRPMWGFTLSSEPFFRSLIKASIKFSITKQLRKEQIQIPKELGRSMLGVVDETGQLQYGQIFVQYTQNAAKKLPMRGPNMTVPDAKIVTGTVLVTKNPCIVTGDVRVFEAVDIPELHHMCDVVVFPQHGPRPHPDEMAGSDLDGDEYSIIWDQQLLLDRNEDPFDFSVEKKDPVPFDFDQIDDLMRDFYVKYLKLDSVGTISNNHLHNSDQYGLTSTVCMNLAKKNSQAVDFTKSGDPPAPLTREWGKDPETGENIPPEGAERIPDYHMANERVPMYVSPRLCGRLFREFQAIDNVIKISEERDEQFEVQIDETLMIQGYEAYMEGARKDLANYNGQLRAIMETYGIRTEGEIMSDCILDMRNRISDRDQDDKMSFYNTNQMIETRTTALFCRFRENFFKEFHDFQAACTEIQNSNDSTNPLNFRCDGPSVPMLQKAVAWYRACYEFAQSSRETRKLSFAWIVFDVLAKVKEHNMLHGENVEMGGGNPMSIFLEAHRAQYIADNFEEFQEFRTMSCLIEDDRSVKGVNILRRYMARYDGLDTVLFVLMKWGEAMHLFHNQPIRKYQFFLMFILFATRQIGLADLLSETFIARIVEDDVENASTVPLTEDKKSHMMSKFLEFMACRKFRKLRSISFRALGIPGVYMRGEWHIFHVASIKTYYNILFNLRFEELPISTDPTITLESMIRESEPYTIELPKRTEANECLKMLTTKSGCQEVHMRMQSNRAEDKKRADEENGKEKCDRVRYMVSARGNVESLQRLKQLTAVTIPIRSHIGGKEVASQMANLCLDKIMEGSDRG